MRLIIIFTLILINYIQLGIGDFSGGTMIGTYINKQNGNYYIINDSHSSCLAINECHQSYINVSKSNGFQVAVLSMFDSCNSTSENNSVNNMQNDPWWTTFVMYPIKKLDQYGMIPDFSSVHLCNTSSTCENTICNIYNDPDVLLIAMFTTS